MPCGTVSDLDDGTEGVARSMGLFTTVGQEFIVNLCRFVSSFRCHLSTRRLQTEEELVTILVGLRTMSCSCTCGVRKGDRAQVHVVNKATGCGACEPGSAVAVAWLLYKIHLIANLHGPAGGTPLSSQTALVGRQTTGIGWRAEWKGFLRILASACCPGHTSRSPSRCRGRHTVSRILCSGLTPRVLRYLAHFSFHLAHCI